MHSYFFHILYVFFKDSQLVNRANKQNLNIYKYSCSLTFSIWMSSGFVWAWMYVEKEMEIYENRLFRVV